MSGEGQAADEDGPEPQLPADAHGRQAEGDEGVLAHVRRDGDRPVGVEAHEERAEGRGQDGRHRARPLRDAGEAEDGRVDDDDVGHRDEGRRPAQDLGPDGRPLLPELEEPRHRRVRHAQNVAEAGDGVNNRGAISWYIGIIPKEGRGEMVLAEKIRGIVVLAAAAALALSPACARGQGTSRTQTVEIREYKGEKLDPIEKFEENSIKGPQHVDIKAYRLKVDGLVAKPLSLSYDEVLARPVEVQGHHHPLRRGLGRQGPLGGRAARGAPRRSGRGGVREHGHFPGRPTATRPPCRSLTSGKRISSSPSG